MRRNQKTIITHIASHFLVPLAQPSSLIYINLHPTLMAPHPADAENSKPFCRGLRRPVFLFYMPLNVRTDFCFAEQSSKGPETEIPLNVNMGRACCCVSLELPSVPRPVAREVITGTRAIITPCRSPAENKLSAFIDQRKLFSEMDRNRNRNTLSPSPAHSSHLPNSLCCLCWDLFHFSSTCSILGDTFLKTKVIGNFYHLDTSVRGVENRRARRTHGSSKRY